MMKYLLTSMRSRRPVVDLKDSFSVGLSSFPSIVVSIPLAKPENVTRPTESWFFVQVVWARYLSHDTLLLVESVSLYRMMPLSVAASA